MERLNSLLEKIKLCKEIFFPKQERPLDDFSALDLIPVQKFLEDFIGVIIIGFETYNDQIKNLERDIQAKMVVGVEVRDKDIWLKLSKINGKAGGYLKISPTVFGQFAESSDKDQAMVDALYQLTFYGGVVLEYTDFKGKGMIKYYPPFIEGGK